MSRGSEKVQLPLALRFEAAMGRDDFFPSPSNEEALRWIETWPQWPSRVLVLIGPAGSGKTHLANIWCGIAGARMMSAETLHRYDVTAFAAAGNLAIETAPGGAVDERALFHVLNAAAETDSYVLITTRQYPAEWGLDLPDLLTRLKAAPVVLLQSPDDALLRAVLVKLFADRRVAVDEGVVEYLVARMERSLAAAGEVVDRLDREALARKTAVTRSLAGRILGELRTDAGAEP